MPARRLTTVLPATALAGALETTRIHRVAGRTGGRTALAATRPCRAPRLTISDAGRIGGGYVPMPGVGLRVGPGETRTGVGAGAGRADVDHAIRPAGRRTARSARPLTPGCLVISPARADRGGARDHPVISRLSTMTSPK
jgi:Magnesium chelatase, subunit ChlI